MIKFKPFDLAGTAIALLWVMLAAAPYGCSRSPFDGMQEGKVVYEVTYETEGMNPMVKAMLPSEVVTYFSDNKTSTVISMGMNIMEMRMISDSKNQKHTVLFDGMGNKVALVLDKDQVEKNFKDRVQLQVRHTSETKEIAGVKCKQAIITDSTNHTYPVYYTDELALEAPNWSSSFSEIDGLLMEYSFSMNGIVFNLKAKEIVNIKNDQAFFEVPQGYKVVTDPSEVNFNM